MAYKLYGNVVNVFRLFQGGVLEIKKEDELKKDVPIPSFMQAKGMDDWSEEEQKQHKEYERKVKELNEEREKYRKVCL